MSLLTAPARLTSRLLGRAIERLRPAAPAAPPMPVGLAASVQSAWISGRAQELWCEPGEHAWARAAVRGRKPSACPAHRVL